jgi:membrane-associated protease RseP (regulator of RpoE activity)
MSSPKHLWSGDWEQDSDAAAADRAGRRLPELPEPPAARAPEPVRTPEPVRAPDPVRASDPVRAAEPAPPRPAPTPPRPASKPPRPKRRYPRRAVALACLFAALIAGGAIALSNAHTGSGPGGIGRSGPWLGVQLQSVPVNQVLVDGVTPGSPADQAGIGAGDVIVAVNGKPVASPGDVDAALGGMHVGQTVAVSVERGPLSFTTQATLTRQPVGYP